MAATFIVNPAAGGLRGLRPLQAVRAAAAAAGMAAAVCLTERPGHATELARAAAARGQELVVAVGGDGTANEVAAGLVAGSGAAGGPGASSGTGPALAVVPLGTGNDLAAELGMPRSWRHAIAALPGAARRVVDVGWVRQPDTSQPRIFLQLAGAGLDGYINQLRGRGRRMRGQLAYTKCAIQALLTFPPATVTLTLDGQRWTQRARAVVVANGRFCGGGMRLAPAARPDDGVFDVVVIGDIPTLEALLVFPLVYAGAHTWNRHFRLLRGRHLQVAADRPLPAHVDGTLIGATPLEVTLQPRALTVLSLR